MTKRDRERIVRELCAGYKARLLKCVRSKQASDWNGLEIRAIFAEMASGELQGSVKNIHRRMIRTGEMYEML